MMTNRILKYDEDSATIIIRGSYLKLMKLTKDDIALTYDNIIYAFNDTYHTGIKTRSIGLGIIKRYENLIGDLKEIKNATKAIVSEYNRAVDKFVKYDDYVLNMLDMFSLEKFKPFIETNKWSFGATWEVTESKLIELDTVSKKMLEVKEKYNIIWNGVV